MSTRDEVDTYLAQMDRTDGRTYSLDFRDGFRHALAMLDAGGQPIVDGYPSPMVREAAREALRRLDTVTVWAEAQAERDRAHAKHGDKSMEAWPADHPARLSILMEEVGEVAREFNEAGLNNVTVDYAALRAELIQVTAMAGAWADAIDGP